MEKSKVSYESALSKLRSVGKLKTVVNGVEFDFAEVTRSIDKHVRKLSTTIKELKGEIQKLQDKTDICQKEKIEKTRNDWEEREKETFMRLQNELNEIAISLKQKIVQAKQKRQNEDLRTIEDVPSIISSMPPPIGPLKESAIIMEPIQISDKTSIVGIKDTIFKSTKEEIRLSNLAVKQVTTQEITPMDEDIEEMLVKSAEIDPLLEKVQIVMEHYKKYLTIYNATTALLKAFMSNDSLKNFRAECQKAVNVPVNAISGVSSAHLKDKLEKLSNLLYCGQRQGEDLVSVKPETAFPIALVVLELWGRFPLFGNLLMAVFHKVCPYLVPIYWVKEENMSDEEYYRKLGFKYTDGELEDIDMFLKRQGGIVRLYFSIVVSHMRDESRPHPLPLSEAWRWLAAFTSLDPSAEITATLLYDMLEVTGHELVKTYKHQFTKLMSLISAQFLPKIQAVTPEGKSGPVCRLKSLLQELYQNRIIKPPKGILPQDFW